MDVRLRTLGGLKVLRAGADVAALDSQPHRAALLVYLALEREVLRQSVLPVFWPDSDPERARHALSQALYDIRRALELDIPAGQGERIHADAIEVDALEFERRVEAGETGEVLKLYGGSFLAGVQLPRSLPLEQWVDRQRARFGRAHRAARRATIERDVARGDVAGALAHARGWAAVDPLEDEAHHRIIELLGAGGHRAEALEQYERYRRIVMEELEVEPLEQTQELVARIRVGEFGAGALAPLATAAAPVRPGPAVVAPSRSVDVARSGSAELAPQRGDDLELLRPIGDGDTALVYLAREPALGRLVAVKVLRHELASDPTARARFEREARAAAAIQHPNVLAVHRVGTLPTGLPYLVMPRVVGTDLRRVLRAVGPLAPTRVREILRQVADALAAAASIGVLHRDVKPANVLIEQGSERVLLADFGIAAALLESPLAEERLTRTGEIAGELSYRSPEQLAHEPLTDRADVYGLGVLGYELLHGRPPGAVDESSPHTTSPAESPAFDPAVRAADPALVDLLTRCLARDPRDRPSAAAVAAMLGGAVSRAAWPRALPPDHRKVRFWIVLAVLALAAAIAAIISAVAR